MAPCKALTLVLGSALAVSCSGETLEASRTAPEENVEAMLEGLSSISSKILSSANPTEDLPGVAKAFETLSEDYDGAAMQAHSIPVDRTEIQKNFEAKGQDSQAAIYGELVPQSAAAMLQFALKQNPNIKWDSEQHHRYEVTEGTSEHRPKFFDLGSGFGKISMLAALLGFDAGGYELARPRILAACAALAKLAGRASSDVAQEQARGTEATGSGGANAAAAVQDSPPHEQCALAAQEGDGGHGELNFFSGSFTDPSVNLEDADVIFTDSVFWSPEMMDTLAAKASKMKPGSIIFSYKPFPGQRFDGLETLSLPTTWSSSTDWQVQRVKPVEEPAQQVVEPEGSKNLRGQS